MTRVQKPIQLTPAAHAAVVALRDQLAAKAGRPLTLAETVARAVACLTDAHAEQRWLSASEAARALRARTQEAIAMVVGQIATALGHAPIRLTLSADGDSGTLDVVCPDGQPLAVGFSAAVEIAEHSQN